MRQKIKLAVVYAGFGAGHVQTTNALIEAAGDEIEIEQIDFAALAGSPIYDLTTELYNRMPGWYRPVFALSYHATKHLRLGSKLKETYIRAGMGPLEEALRKMQPDAVIAAFPAAVGMCSLMKRSGALKARLTAIVTDADVHSGWLFSEPEATMVMDEDTRAGVIRYGLPPEKVFVTGIPIRRQFCRSYDRAEQRARFGMDPQLPAALIGAGGKGSGAPLLKLTKWADSASIPLQLVVLTGENEAARCCIAEYAAEAKHKILLPGYVTEMAPLMQCCDVYITKPGGITMAETLACDLPMLACNPLPGQEKQNLKMLLRKGAAIKKGPFDKADTLLYRALISDRRSLRDACETLARRNAAEEVLAIALGKGP